MFAALNSYNPIITDSTKTTFFDYINYLNLPIIDYFAIGIQDCVNKKSISLMSRPEWQEEFTKNSYANFDPVRKATLFTKRNIITFNEIDHIDSFGKEIMNQRSLFDIKNGLILMQRSPKFNYMITLGTGFTKFDEYTFLKKYYNTIHNLKSDFIKIIEKDAINFLPLKFIHP